VHKYALSSCMIELVTAPIVTAARPQPAIEMSGAFGRSGGIRARDHWCTARSALFTDPILTGFKVRQNSLRQ
jgi:hypothetical protein